VAQKQHTERLCGFQGARRQPRRMTCPNSGLGRRAFSLIDLLVSIGVIAILISILAPSLRMITEAARRVVCQSQLAQIGVGLTMWTDDHRGKLPPSDFTDDVYSGPGEPFQPSGQMELLHLGDDPNAWDGLGLLFSQEYLAAPSLFYDPSHTGLHPEERYESAWVMLDDQIVGNYHYRLFPTGEPVLADLDPDTTLVTDGMRSVADYNHHVGNNMLKADMSVVWYRDDEDFVIGMLPQSEQAPNAGVPVMSSWFVMDTGQPPPDTTNPQGDPGSSMALPIP